MVLLFPLLWKIQNMKTEQELEKPSLLGLPDYLQSPGTLYAF